MTIYGLDQSPPTARQARCDWCTNSLNELRHVYKGRGCERYYCSSEHLKKGEERALLRTTRAAGMQSPWHVGVAAILAVFMLAFTFTGGSRAWAQGHAGHAENHEVYKDWKQSNGFSSCCNGDNPETGVKGDCRPVRAYQDPDDGHWRALLKGKWEKVPPAAVRPYSTPDGNSHICEDERNGIMCFVGGKPKA